VELGLYLWRVEVLMDLRHPVRGDGTIDQQHALRIQKCTNDCQSQVEEDPLSAVAQSHNHAG
jgi:hypothetical protein